MSRGVAVDGRTARRGSTVAERLALHSRLDADTGCILWTGATHDVMGYGRMGVGSRMQYVHRLAWEQVHGPVPDGLVLRHSCDRPSCLNVDHLSVGTQRENVADIYARGRVNDRTGEANNSAHLTWDRVRALRAERRLGASVADLSARFEISKSQVRNVLAGTHWKEPTSMPEMTVTVARAIELTGVDVLDHLDRQAEIPLCSGLVRQGDVIVVPLKGNNGQHAATPIPREGIPVVRGENGGNTHLMLTESGTVRLDLNDRVSATDLVLAVMTVEPGSVAVLAHPEHAFTRIAPGSYEVRRQREQADELRLVAD